MIEVLDIGHGEVREAIANIFEAYIKTRVDEKAL